MVDPQVRALLDSSAKSALPVTELDLEQVREQARTLLQTSEPLAPCHTTELTAGKSRARLYMPARRLRGAPPLILYFHGGGFVTGDIDSYEPLTRSLCHGTGCAVLSVDYRLSPEARFPAAVTDCWNAVQWASENAAALGVDGRRLVVGGDSAGANLAAVSAILARDAGAPMLRGQLLIYPVTDHYGAAHPSYELFARGYGLTRDAMVWFWDHYLSDAREAAHPRASPLREANLRGVASAFVCTAGFDPLRDEGEAYGYRLREAGVPTTIRRYDRLVHGFIRMPRSIPAVREALDDVCNWVVTTTSAK